MADQQTVIDANSINNQQSNAKNKMVKNRPAGATYPEWSVWKKRGLVKLWEAVALSKNIHPPKLELLREQKHKKVTGYASRLKTAISWLEIELKIYEHPDSGNESKDKMILLSEYVRIAQSKGVKITPKLIEITIESKQLINNNDNSIGKKTRNISSGLEERNENLQNAATKVAIELRNKKPRYPVTKTQVATELKKTGDWPTMSIPRIERIIKKNWK